jgi:hypothetical protein
MSQNFTITLNGTINDDGTGVVTNSNSSIKIDNMNKTLTSDINFDNTGKITEGDISFTGGSRKSSRKTNRKRYLGKGKRGKSMRRRQ